MRYRIFKFSFFDKMVPEQPLFGSSRLRFAGADRKHTHQDFRIRPSDCFILVPGEHMLGKQTINFCFWKYCIACKTTNNNPPTRFSTTLLQHDMFQQSSSTHQTVCLAELAQSKRFNSNRSVYLAVITRKRIREHGAAGARLHFFCFQ